MFSISLSLSHSLSKTLFPLRVGHLSFEWCGILTFYRLCLLSVIIHSQSAYKKKRRLRIYLDFLLKTIKFVSVYDFIFQSWEIQNYHLKDTDGDGREIREEKRAL